MFSRERVEVVIDQRVAVQALTSYTACFRDIRMLNHVCELFAEDTCYVSSVGDFCLVVNYRLQGLVYFHSWYR